MVFLKWAWPGSRDPTIFGIRLNIFSQLLELESLNLVSGFDLPLLYLTVGFYNLHTIWSTVGQYGRLS